jgi:2-polyprenyl-3-methyl-5-hydroxy-6-metoxy-1,4-benzoquinol methylase
VQRDPASVVRGVRRRLRAAADALRGVAPEVPATAGGWWSLLPFTTHRIELAPGVPTMDGGVDALGDIRTHLVLDAVGGSLAGRTVVDLGCLEGGFTLAFAGHGARHALGIEARQVSVRRCELARALLGYDNAEFVCGDIKDELANRDPFDVVFAAGILYHVGDPAEMVRTMRRACSGVALIDTHVARVDRATHGCSEIVERSSGGHTYRGRMFPEYPAGLGDSDKEELLWAAWSDADAFWPLEDDLVAMLRDAGFSSVDKIDPLASGGPGGWGVDQEERVVYLARV